MTRKRMKTPLRMLLAAAAAALTLWTVSALSASTSLGAAMDTLRRETLPLALLRHTLGRTDEPLDLSFDTALVLSFSPILSEAKDDVATLWQEKPPEIAATVPPAPKPTEPSSLPTLRHTDNGVPSRTLRPAGSEGYVIAGKTYIGNASSCELSPADLTGDLPDCPTDGPQVLIVHTHATESYTMPAGEEYVPSDEWRTLEEEKNMLCIGDEMAADELLGG